MKLLALWTMKLCSWAMVTHIFLQNKLFVIPFEVRVVVLSLQLLEVLFNFLRQSCYLAHTSFQFVILLPPKC